ncbi:hypothetical protein GCM10010112_47520 [Actinoplanes lobatus]|uniref:Uncharacterized protein n=1 Tax=Actinoplanes lobatus TaxID=113568 RepID=A0A7W7HFP0_9ACTN|nr:hypothetical protein [Actinoplanes lobatus]MBB4749706.1 hypothetical protein [Actinoplanes lobatus]GGN75856.1 hypothetical protein GCM10010112_47520 [Actinoplanes lobatus]GIE38444.1 hypothetical protein Alo02nite_13420 [Actinoplanes lobatus]
MNRNDLPSALLAANPAPDAEPGDAERLAAIRAAVDHRRHSVAISSAPRRHGRRLAVLAGLTTAAVVVTVAGTRLWSPEPDPLISAAIAMDGSLSCGAGIEGYAEPIRPDKASVRLFPTVIPDGWRLVNVFARSSTWPAACTVPSLMAADLDDGAVMRGGVWVNGPVDRISYEEDGAGMNPKPVRTDDTLNGRPAVRYDWQDSISWVWSDERGKYWQATVSGYPLDQARKIMAAARTDGDQVVWSGEQVPQMRVLHQRTGPRYPAETPTEDWYIRLTDGHGDWIVNVRSGRLEPLAADLRTGLRLESLDGHTLIEGKSGLSYEAQPGSWADTEVRGDPAAVRALLAGLRHLPADDPRLDEYAMKE